MSLESEIKRLKIHLKKKLEIFHEALCQDINTLDVEKWRIEGADMLVDIIDTEILIEVMELGLNSKN